MSLSKQAIDKFKAIYKEEFGEEISYEEARHKAERLINLLRVIYRPIPDYKEKHDQERND